MFHLTFTCFSYLHSLSLVNSMENAHRSAIKSIASSPGMMFTGSTDKVITMWNMENFSQQNLNVDGEIQHIHVVNSCIFWSMDVVLPGSPDPVGILTMMDMNSSNRIVCKVRHLRPTKSKCSIEIGRDALYTPYAHQVLCGYNRSRW